VLRALNPRNLNVVDLSDKVSIRTSILQEHHPAMRCGFAGYPANPRWNVSKYQAWKTGRQLREALSQGLMVVRQSDSLLIPIGEEGEMGEDKPPSTFLPYRLEFWRSPMPITYQLA
jgi:hypothetical protein